MIIFEAVHTCTPDPSKLPLMHPKGYRIYLEPDKYPKHAALADKLKRLSSWMIVSQTSNEVVEPEVEKPAKDELLPHQRQVLERLRLNK